MTKIDFNILDKTVSFDVFPTTLGDNFKNCKVLGILDAQDTREMNFDPAAQHRNFYGTLPPGTPNDAFAYKYLRVQLMNGQRVFVGIPWIRQETLKVTGALTLKITIDNVSLEDREIVIKALAGNGYVAASVVVAETV